MREAGSLDRSSASPGTFPRRQATTRAFAGKLRPPQQRLATTPRTLLLEKIDSRRRHPMLVVRAPPGFGKTTLLSQAWHQEASRPGRIAAWLTLDEDDGEPTTFLSNLILALADAGLDVGALADLASRHLPQAEAQSLAVQLLDLFDRAGTPVTIFLDDYHRVRSAATDALVELLARHACPGVYIVIAGRDRPSFATASAQLQGLFANVEAAELAFSPDETLSLLASEVSPDDLAVLHARTEGWPVALQLAKIWLDRDDQRSAELIGFSGRTSEIARYLTEQVLADLSDEQRDFLVETSILDRFDANLADVVRRRADSAAILASLEHFDALVVSLDAEQSWFRHHHLFADFLRQRLLLTGRERMEELHGRAAAYLDAQGQLPEAVRHAVRSGDIAYAASLIARAGSWELILSRGIGYVRNLLRNFDDADADAHAVIALVQGYLLLKLGDLPGARRRIEAAARLGTGPRGRDQIIVEALLRTYADDVRAPDWAGQLDAELRHLAPSDHLGRGTLLAAQAVRSLGEGDFAAGELAAETGLVEMRRAGSVLGETYCRLHLAQSWFHRGDLAQARAVIDAALATAEEHYGADSALKSIGTGVQASLLYWQGETARAADALAAALPAIEAQDSWSDIIAVAARTGFALARQRGDAAAAAALLARTAQVAQQRDLPGYDDLCHAWRLELLVAEGGEAASRFVESEGLPARAMAATSPFDWRQRFALDSALAQWEVSAGRSAAAIQRLRTLRHLCAQGGRLLDTARVDLLLALAYRAREMPAEMVKSAAAAIDFAVANGGAGLFLDPVLPVDGLIVALERDHRGEVGEARAAYLGQLRPLLRPVPAEPDDALTGRERAVLELVCRGCSNKAIGATLDLSENTVKFHLKRLYSKLGVSSRSGAVMAAIDRGLVRREAVAALPERVATEPESAAPTR